MYMIATMHMVGAVHKKLCHSIKIQNLGSQLAPQKVMANFEHWSSF